jgi:hypothetical protein
MPPLKLDVSSSPQLKAIDRFDDVIDVYGRASRSDAVVERKAILRAMIRQISAHPIRPRISLRVPMISAG